MYLTADEIQEASNTWVMHAKCYGYQQEIGECSRGQSMPVNHLLHSCSLS